MELGVHLPLISLQGEQRTLADLTAFTSTAASLGYTMLCANDHLVFARPWLDGPTALAAVLEHSGSMQLMTTVALPVVRGPAATAKTLGAIDLLSGGRLTVGVGPGSSARDYELAGVPFEERWKRLDDAVEVLRAFWGGKDHDSPYYRATGFRLEPLPRRESVPARAGPPIWIGSWGSPAGLRRVARLADGWLASGYNTTPEAFGKAWADLGELLLQRGRDPASFPNAIATMWTYVTEDAVEADRVLREVLAPMLNRPVEELRAKLPVGTPEECVAKLAAYARAGAQQVFLWPVQDEVEQLRRFRTEVWPQLLEVT